MRKQSSNKQKKSMNIKRQLKPKTALLTRSLICLAILMLPMTASSIHIERDSVDKGEMVRCINHVKILEQEGAKKDTLIKMHERKDITQQVLIGTQKKSIRGLKARIVWEKLKNFAFGLLAGVIIMVL